MDNIGGYVMTREEFISTMVEWTLIALTAECESFSDFYNLDFLRMDYEMHGQTGDLYLYEHEEKTKILTVDFYNAPKIMRYPVKYVMADFQKILDKYEIVKAEMQIVPVEEEAQDENGAEV